MIPEATHQPMLKEFISKTTKPILELGAGDSSTRQIHEWCQNRILTVDDSAYWLNKHIDLQDERHAFRMLDDYQDEDWGLVFVDLINWDLRKEAILKYKDADYVVIHDSEWMFAHVINADEFSKLYKYWKEFKELGEPFTVVASNINEL